MLPMCLEDKIRGKKYKQSEIVGIYISQFTNIDG